MKPRIHVVTKGPKIKIRETSIDNPFGYSKKEIKTLENYLNNQHKYAQYLFCDSIELKTGQFTENYSKFIRRYKDKEFLNPIQEVFYDVNFKLDDVPRKLNDKRIYSLQTTEHIFKLDNSISIKYHSPKRSFTLIIPGLTYNENYNDDDDSWLYD